MSKLCAVCFIPTNKCCSSCKTLFFCSELHQNSLFKSHKFVCSLNYGKSTSNVEDEVEKEEEEFRNPPLNESECKLIRQFCWNEFNLPPYTVVPVTKENPTPLSNFLNSHLISQSNTLPSISLSQLLAKYRNKLSSICPTSFAAATTHSPSLFPYYQLASLQLKAIPISNRIKNPFLRSLCNFYALQYVQGLFEIDRNILNLQLEHLEKIVNDLEKFQLKGGALLRCYFGHVKNKEMILREKMDDLIEDDEFDRKNEEETERFEKILRTFGSVLAI